MTDNKAISDLVNSECKLLLLQDKNSVLTPNYTIRQNNKPQMSLSEEKINLHKQQAIKEHAKYLGMDLLVDKEFLWIAMWHFYF